MRRSLEVAMPLRGCHLDALLNPEDVGLKLRSRTESVYR